MPDCYFMSGYTGFCPNLPQKIGQNYVDSTREIMRECPDMRSRLGEVHFREAQTGDVTYRSGNTYKCNYTPEMPSCNRDDSTGRCPLKAHPLACTQFGSACMDKCCDTQCCDKSPRNQGDMAFMLCENEANSRHFKECHPCEKPEVVCYPGYCGPGGPCGEELGCCVKLPKPRAKPVLPNCNPCVRDPLEMKKIKAEQQQRPVASEVATSSAKEGCRCCCPPVMLLEKSEGAAGGCDQGCGEKPNMVKPPCFQYKYRNVKMRPYRKCGVIPNYMGYIPGMQMTFGETYGITANRLLKRHFNEQRTHGCY